MSRCTKLTKNTVIRSRSTIINMMFDTISNRLFNVLWFAIANYHEHMTHKPDKPSFLLVPYCVDPLTHNIQNGMLRDNRYMLTIFHRHHNQTPKCWIRHPIKHHMMCRSIDQWCSFPPSPGRSRCSTTCHH